MRAIDPQGRYVLGAPIASGGTASVHVGRLHGTGFVRTVAIKRLHAGLEDDAQLVAMLLDEARMSACIHHPNVVSMLDVVVADDGIFLVLEYVHGESLARLLAAAEKRGERIPAPIAASIVAGALHGLHAAHEAKDEHGAPLEIVHRDVSPQNILVDTHGAARLLDFGVAKARGRRQVSELGALKGKVAYMAPEQVHGTVSRASDVFSMGVVLWEALTGDRLFDGKSDGEVLAAVVLAKVPPVRSRAPDVPVALDEAVLRSLRKRPDDRFATALDFARAIEESVPVAPPAEVAAWLMDVAKESLAKRDAILADEARGDAEADATVSNRRAVRARRAPIAWLAGGAIALVAGGVFAARALTRTAPPRDAAVASEVASAAAAPSHDDADDAPDAAFVPSLSVGDRSAAFGAPSSEPRRTTSRAPRGRCDPPYTIDGKGHKIYKRECF